MNTFNVSINANYVFGYKDGYDNGYKLGFNDGIKKYNNKTYNTKHDEGYGVGYKKGYHNAIKRINNTNGKDIESTKYKYFNIIYLLLVVFVLYLISMN